MQHVELGDYVYPLAQSLRRTILAHNNSKVVSDYFDFDELISEFQATIDEEGNIRPLKKRSEIVSV